MPKYKIIGVGELQSMLRRTLDDYGQDYVIVNEKEKTIVGKIKIMKSPKRVSRTEYHFKPKNLN